MNFDKTAIEEANKHLQALSQRVIELDEIVKQQAERLDSIEEENQAKILAVVRQKDAEIEQRNAWLNSTQAEIRRLNIEVINKDVTISQLTAKAAILDKASRYKGELDGLLNCFVEAEYLRAAALGLTGHGKTCLPNPNISQYVSTSSAQTQNMSVQAHNSASSISEEDFSEREQINVVWTPKAKIQDDHENLQNLSSNGRKVYVHPPKVPGGAVKNKGDTLTPMDAESEQTSQRDSESIPENLSDSRGGSPTLLANYETQL